MNPRTRTELIRILEKVVARQFDGDDISLMFVKLRQFIKSELLKDVAHYIAHPEERTQGISHREIDLQYQKVRRVANQSPRLPLTPIADDFMRLWAYGVTQTEPKFAEKYFGGDRQTARKLVEQSYEKAGNFWMLRTSVTVRQRQALSQILHGVFNSLKPKPLFTQRGVIEELQKSILRLQLPRSGHYAGALASLEDELTVCVMCCMQHAPLKLMDGTTASLHWSHCDGGPNLGLYSGFRIPYAPPPDGYLNIRIQHFTSNVKAADFIDGPVEESMLLAAIREANGRLTLVKGDI